MMASGIGFEFSSRMTASVGVLLLRSLGAPGERITREELSPGAPGESTAGGIAELESVGLRL